MTLERKHQYARVAMGKTRLPRGSLQVPSAILPDRCDLPGDFVEATQPQAQPQKKGPAMLLLHPIPE